MRTLIEYRVVLAMALSSVIGVVGLDLWPFPADNVFLALVAARRPSFYRGLAYAYATVWCLTPLLVLNVGASLFYIFVARLDRPATRHPLPPYPPPEDRADLYLVLGERHHRTSPTRAPTPEWLIIPERGLYTGLAIIGAIGTGKTSACISPYVEQLLAYRADDPARRLGGLVLEVKGDFCRHVKDILERHGRGGDYIEVSLTSPYRYNPLHNDLDAYALAYGIATLMTNLFGRGTEPFWQQASTNLVKFVILLHQILDGYVTLFQVYEHVINPDKLRAKIAEGDVRFTAQHRRVVVDKRTYLATPALSVWTWHQSDTGHEMWTYWSADLGAIATAQHIEHRVEETAPAPEEAEKVAQFEAVTRWFEDDWMRIEPKLRTTIVEGISVFLSLFDDNPKVKHTFCPPKETYDPAQNPDGRYGTPLPPLAELIDHGKVIALNFPVALNPGLARPVGCGARRGHGLASGSHNDHRHDLAHGGSRPASAGRDSRGVYRHAPALSQCGHAGSCRRPTWCSTNSMSSSMRAPRSTRSAAKSSSAPGP